MEKNGKMDYVGTPLDIMELMEVRGGVGRNRKMCMFRSAVKCTGEGPGTIENGKPCKGERSATRKHRREDRCLIGKAVRVSCTGGSLGVKTCSGEPAVTSR